MQHLISTYREEDVVNEAEAEKQWVLRAAVSGLERYSRDYRRILVKLLAIKYRVMAYWTG